jgi:ABC-type sulfate/molybdate transport systems ATPase subunit
VLERGQIMQLGPPAALLEKPDNALVARLTGSNTLAGTAEASGASSIVRLDGGGELTSSTVACGPVQVAIAPWAVELTDPADGQLADTVLSVRQDRDALVVRLTRLTVRVPGHDNGRLAIVEGSRVGLRVAPEDVRLFS